MRPFILLSSVLSFLSCPALSIFAPPEDGVAAFGGIVGWARVCDFGGTTGPDYWIDKVERLFGVVDMAIRLVFLRVSAQKEDPFRSEDDEYAPEDGRNRAPEETTEG